LKDNFLLSERNIRSHSKTEKPPSSGGFINLEWWAIVDSDHRPLPCQGAIGNHKYNDYRITTNFTGVLLYSLAD
jgi:hypothetical protein